MQIRRSATPRPRPACGSQVHMHVLQHNMHVHAAVSAPGRRAVDMSMLTAGRQQQQAAEDMKGGALGPCTHLPRVDQDGRSASGGTDPRRGSCAGWVPISARRDEEAAACICARCRSCGQTRCWPAPARRAALGRRERRRERRGAGGLGPQHTLRCAVAPVGATAGVALSTGWEKPTQLSGPPGHYRG